MSPVRVIVGIVCAALVLNVAERAAAQGASSQRPYAGGAIFGDFKWFSGADDQHVLDGHAAGGGIVVGAPVGRRWDLELDVDAPGFSRTSRPYEVTFKRSVITLESATRNRMMSVATIVRLQGARRGRLSVGYRGGLAFLVLRREHSTAAPAGTPASIIPKPFVTTDFTAAPVVGADVRIAFGPHLSLVPAIEASAFRFDDASGVVVRPRLGVHWRF